MATPGRDLAQGPRDRPGRSMPIPPMITVVHRDVASEADREVAGGDDRGRAVARSP
jgi:hypothetical protein